MNDFDPKSSKWGAQLHRFGEDKRGQRVIIFGPYGSGKTTLAASYPAPVFIDTDAGENTATKGLPYFTIPPMKAYETAQGILMDFLSRKDVFAEGAALADRETIVIDSWTKLNEMILTQICLGSVGARHSIMQDNERPTISQYGFLLTRQQTLVNIIREITRTGRNVIITATPMVEGSEEERKLAGDGGEMKMVYDEVIGIPNLVGKFKYQIGAEFDEVYYLDFAPQGTSRVLYTTRHGIWRAKTRQPLPAVISNPSWEVIKSKLGA